MGVWEFVVVYLAAFVLVQLAIYRYLRGRRGEEARVTFAGPSSADRVPRDDGVTRDDRLTRDDREPREGRRIQDVSDGRREREDSIRRCPSCGASNDPDEPYTFCRNCASRLPG